MPDARAPRHLPWTLLLAGLFAAGCDGDSKSESAAPGVEIPEITGDVSSDDFCALYDQISCAGSLGCCDDSNCADAADCEAGSTCSSDLASVLASESVTSGVVTYDAAAAGDYLRGLASSTSSCDPGKDTSSWIWAVFAGSLSEGSDCSTSDDDLAGPLRCTEGLACDVTVDDEAGTETYACATAPVSMGSHGDSCVDDEGCDAGSCVDNECVLSVEDVYCADAEDTGAPSNADVISTDTTPEGLRA